ncbi:dethiobiotin synthase [Mucilaginibacter ginsenosidivorax]|uniref:ATP-dependent dethiobiotin synthetase BioD n=1 Tax=Mucilaginibacter ginsenosidivorax TaxID=862126 RepID=A0A5B8VSL4_9SPHI|nr:dethiobiotin synthase [Mucilaginibacter ginsenosidivorax]QEC74429.1 dethiobiotin synthase [Mucilaginibacter ginsenosidivorax]QEC80345.1 dethiobiotin synthase [Mucilaginibacter ginsenosidivorax]
MPAKQPIFITGIGTGIGKTITSAIVTEKLKADYWKPIQSGDLDNSDTMKVQSLVSNPITKFHTEAYRLTQPFSPHKSAAIDKISIDMENIVLPKTDNQLVIEGAGGLMVPLNDNFLMIDLIKQLNPKVILVSQHYLGSINHTLLSIHALKKYNIDVIGIIFNGAKDIYSKSYILNYSNLPELGTIPTFENLTRKAITDAGALISL